MSQGGGANTLQDAQDDAIRQGQICKRLLIAVIAACARTPARRLQASHSKENAMQRGKQAGVTDRRR
jgi:hypothetical protein